MSLEKLLRLVLMVAAMTLAGDARAVQREPFDRCLLYGFAPRSHDYAQCRMNVRRFWTTGPCGSSEFAFTHREYCHLNPPPFL